MIDKELWLNGSGYADPTAYKAMKGVMDDMRDRIGEVWEVNTNKGTKTVLVVAKKEGAYALLDMFDEPKRYTDITVNLNGEDWHTNSVMFSYCLDDRFAEKVGTLSEDDFNMALETIGRTFDVPMMQVPDPTATVEKDLLENLRKKLEHAVKLLDEKDEEIKQLSGELQDVIMNGDPSADMVRLETERDLYKSLYEQTLERLLAR